MRAREHIHHNMKAVKSRGSDIEQTLGKALWKANLRYRRQYKKLPGKPDFVLVTDRIVIFCDSHFWHGYRWEERKLDHKSNKNFWYNKIERNMERDKEVNDMLIEMGWKIIRFWEHEIKKDVEICVSKVRQQINNQ
jgi:DNA mismatch endonuclease, patch repair protein